MSTTVSYKGNTIATLNNETKTLTTAGTWVEGNITVTDTMSGVKPKVTITSTGHSSSCYVQYNGTKYYTAEDSFEFNEGDTLYCYAAHSEGGSIYINDETVAISSTTGVNYTLTLGKYDVNVQLSYSRSPVIRISLPIIPSGTYSVSNSGTFPIPNYSKVSVAAGTEGTPSATKGTVSNHSISITPSVTNSAGYITGSTKTGTAVTVTASELASGNKEITQNGTNIDVVGYSTVSVAVPGANLQSKTGINPTTSSQTIQADSGYDGLSSVQINAMPTMTLPTSASSSSSGTSKATISRSTSNQYINIPTGYNGTASYYLISATPNGTVTAPSSISGTAATVSTGTNTLTLTKTVSVTPNVSTAGYISSGTAGNSSVSLTASVTTKAAATITPGTSNQTIASGTYLTGTQTISGDANLVAGNIKSGVSIFGVAGSLAFSTITVSSSNPSGGSNGDVWIKTS